VLEPGERGLEIVAEVERQMRPGGGSMVGILAQVDLHAVCGLEPHRAGTGWSIAPTHLLVAEDVDEEGRLGRDAARRDAHVDVMEASHVRTLRGRREPVRMPNLFEDRDAIRDLFARYCIYIDTGAADKWADTFTDDGEFIAGPEPVVGRAALQAFAAAIPAGSIHHMVVNAAIDVEGDTARCTSSVLVTGGGAIVITGRNEDELVRIGGDWQIVRHTFTPD
jgi:ketosteroid isomerase-like protein